MSRLAFEFSVPAGHPSLAGHFPGNPVVPGVLLLDHVLHALEQSTGRSVTRLRQVRFVAPLFPGEVAQGYWELADPLASFRVCAQRGGAPVKVAEGDATLSGERVR
ncbi:MAG: dehydratase [Ramlibacter sp.]|nr:dehydratase [Ramlibacter sp.]